MRTWTPAISRYWLLAAWLVACAGDDAENMDGVVPGPPSAQGPNPVVGAGGPGTADAGSPGAGMGGTSLPPSMGAPPVISPSPTNCEPSAGGCADGCPADPRKTAPGACGCGIADTDSDADGTPDCNDACPRDPASTAPGSRCGVAGVDAGAPDAATAPPAMAGMCPPGFESERPLVLTGATVPGNLELGLASAPETPRNPCGLPEEQECLRLLNAERAALGRAPLRWDGDLVDLARSHAADRVQLQYPGTMHGSSTSTMHLYEQRAEFLGLKRGKFRSVVENALRGGRTAASAVQSWLSSAGHRAVIVGEGQWAGYTHAGCGRDGSQWNIEFGR